MKIYKFRMIYLILTIFELTDLRSDDKQIKSERLNEAICRYKFVRFEKMSKRFFGP